ncbi:MULTISPECIES: LolA-related protein [unclassified Wenzhouxiangella]|uniref:LolA-related protein n=1 Tax=unclassified Wenzhouxiangella TaxID=2613841 RepID=UPI000E327BE9|nr:MULTISPECIES: LolA-related protein [unclassified Wenzhouxiangella]RFF27432.1 fatty acyl CoA synthetase [Wenzhouxiangella sp. 15181]RFP68860.1 fatty acyl CoA synthetase [Wenzhouxiangella sp. 15190]
MISGLLTLILIAAATTTDAGAPENLDELLSSLAPEDDRTELHFVERRSSPLLSEPLVVTGRIWRNLHGHLVRQTLEPRETKHTLSSNMVIIERPGHSSRNYSLGHIPELAVLYHGLSALLTGDADALRERFKHELTGKECGEECCWRLTLKPRDEALAAQVESLSLSGKDDRLERFVLALSDGEKIETELSRQP